MKNKNTLTEVGMACHYLENIRKHKEQFEKYPNSSFYLRNNMNGDCMDIPLNEIIKNEISKFLEEQRIINQTILDNNPDLIKVLEMPYP